MLTEFIFRDILELLDLNWRPEGVTTGCPIVHLLPRFVCSDNTTAQLLSPHVIMEHWMNQTKLPLIDVLELAAIQKMTDSEWSLFIHELRGTLAWIPGKVMFYIFIIGPIFLLLDLSDLQIWFSCFKETIMEDLNI